MELAWSDCMARNIIPKELIHMKEGVYVTESGDRLKVITIFNMPIGEPEYVARVVRDKADWQRRLRRYRGHT
jgi:Ser-tRNA(Ala) deacylase AlaX